MCCQFYSLFLSDAFVIFVAYFCVFDLLVFFDSRFPQFLGTRMGEVERPQGPSTLIYHPLYFLTQIYLTQFVPYLGFLVVLIFHFVCLTQRYIFYLSTCLGL